MTDQLSKYQRRQIQGREDYLWRVERKSHYRHLSFLANGITAGLVFLFLMSIPKGADPLITFFLLYLIIGSLGVSSFLRLRSNEYFWSDIKKTYRF